MYLKQNIIKNVLKAKYYQPSHHVGRNRTNKSERNVD